MKDIPEFVLFKKLDFRFQRVEVNLAMVVILLSTVMKVQYYVFNRENNIVFQGKRTFSLCFRKMVVILISTGTFSIADSTLVKATTVSVPFEMNTKLRFIRFGCFLNIHIISRALHGRSQIRILSSRADGTLEGKIAI